MKAVVVPAPGGPEILTIRDVPTPVAQASGATVRVEAVGVNPVDAGNRSDPGWAGITAPYVVGYEFAGTILTVGNEAEGVRPGDAVWGMFPVRGTQWGAMAEIVTVPADLLSPMPSELDFIAAAALPLAGSTALQLLERMQLPRGSWLAVHGASGGVGHLLVQIAHNRGIQVAVSARRDDHDRLRGLGVDLCFDRDADLALATANELGQPVDAVADLVGGRIAPSLASVREGGQLASIVDLSGDLELAVDRNLTLHGVLVRPGRDALAALAKEVTLGLRPNIDEVFSLDNASAAHRRLELGAVRSKIVLTVGRADES